MQSISCRLLTIWVTLAALTPLAPGLVAVEAAAETADRDIISAAVLEFFPFGYRDGTGKVAGLSVDIFEDVAEQADFALDASLLPVPRALSATSRGEVDILYSYRDSEMIKGVEFLGNVGCLTSLVVPRAGISIRSLDDLADRRVGFINAGYFAIRYGDKHGLRPFPLPSNETMFRMLVRDRLDAIVVNDAVLFAYLQRDPHEARLPAGWQEKIGKPYPLETLETHISIGEKSPLFEERGRLISAIREIQKTDAIKKAYQRYGLTHGGSCDPEIVRDALR